jgi:hypothetical protein
LLEFGERSADRVGELRAEPLGLIAGEADGLAGGPRAIT